MIAISWSSFAFCFLCFFTITLAYSGKHKVYRILVSNEDQLKFLTQLRTNVTEDELNFWLLPARIGSFADVMVSTSAEESFVALLNEHGFTNYRITISDVQRLMAAKETDPGTFADMPPNPRFRRDANIYYDFQHYQSYQTMMDFMADVERNYPNIAKTEIIGYTHEGRPIESIKIGSNLGGDKRMIWIDAGIHAREWPTHHAAMYFIYQLVTQYNKDPEITYLVDNLQWMITPCLNPDGYEYARSSDSADTRMWRKNRSPTVCYTLPISRMQRCCPGVDLNRNFDFHFKEVDSSDNPCNEVYAGEKAFSEPETQAVRDAILRNLGSLDAVITMHNYGQVWSHPWGNAIETYPPDNAALEQVSQDATQELSKPFGTTYRFGTAADTIYPASGGLDDWSKSQGVKYVFLLELRPSDMDVDGFILDQSQLLPTAKETWEGVRAVAKAVLRDRGQLPDAATLAQWNNYKATAEQNPSSLADCNNRDSSCEQWVRSNPDYCRTIRAYMQITCPLSCNLCPNSHK